MKTRNHYFISAIVIGFLLVLARGDTELHPPLEEALIGPPAPALVGIEELYVDIRRPGVDPNSDGLVWKELRAKVEHKLTAAGIKMYSGDVRGWPTNVETPILAVEIDLLKLKELKRYVFNSQTSLSRLLHLPIRPRYAFKADVWKKGSRMRTITTEYMPPEVTGVVMEQVDAFIYAYLAANQKYVHPPDVNDRGTVIEKELIKPLPRPAIPIYSYVASKNSKVFHRPECSSAVKISPNNLIGYSNRADATKAGKRPCKRCKP